ncbi:unnamed protein product [Brassica oleracea]
MADKKYLDPNPPLGLCNCDVFIIRRIAIAQDSEFELEFKK